jgi:large subunit ribosomal protein L29
MAKKTSYAGKTEAELSSTEETLRKELFDLKFEHATRNLASSAELGVKRKELARVLTAKNAAKQAAASK